MNSLNPKVIYHPELVLGCNLFIGPSNSGKTYSLKSIIKNSHAQYSNFFVVSRHPQTRKDWLEFFSLINRKPQIFPDLPNGFLEWLVERQQDEKGNVMVIFDDILGSVSQDKQKNIRNESSFDALTMFGRHSRIVSCVLIQTPVGVSASQISNIQTAFVFNNGSAQTREGHLFPKFLSPCDGQWGSWFYSLTKSRRYQLYHKLLHSLKEHECLFLRKENSHFRMYKFKS